MKGKRKIFLIVIVIMLLFSLVLLNSYAWWRISRGQTDSNNLIGGCLNIEFEEVDNSNEGQLVFEKRFPITDEQALSLNGYTFKLTNTCPNEVNYEVVLHSIPKDRQIPDDLVKVQIDDKNPKLFSEYLTVEDNTKKIHTGTLLGQTDDPNNDDNKVTHTVKMWISDEAETNDVADKEFETIIEVRAGQGIQNDMEDDEIIADTCFVINTDGTLVKYNPDCGSNVTIPATYNGLPIKNIASDAFFKKDLIYNFYDEKTKDDIAFGFAVTSNFLSVVDGDYDTDEEEKEAMKSLTSDDLWIVKYNGYDGTDSEIINYLRTADTVGEFISILEENEQEIIVCDLADEGCKQGEYVILYDKSNSHELIGDAYSETFATMMGMDEDEVASAKIFTIEKVDFSQATNLISIEDNAFKPYNDDSLNFPSTLQSIGNSAFYSYTGDNLVLPNSLINVGDKAFFNYKGTNNQLVIPDNVVSVGLGSFAQYDGSNLTLNDGLQSIGEGAFSLYNGTSKLTLPSGLKNIGPGAFAAYVGSGTNLSIPNSVTTIGRSVFQNFKGNSISIGTGLTTIPRNAFFNYTGDELIIPNNITNIGPYAFRLFNGSNLVLSQNLKVVDSYAFNSYNGFNSTLVLPEGLEFLGAAAFRFFSGDKAIIPSTLTEVGYNPFDNSPQANGGVPAPAQIIVKMTEADFRANVKLLNGNYSYEDENKQYRDWPSHLCDFYSCGNSQIIFDPNYDTSSYIHQGN